MISVYIILHTFPTIKGDSGGPLVYKREDASWELIGVVSWGYGCAAFTPGIYVDVYQIRDWLMGIVPELDFGK